MAKLQKLGVSKTRNMETSAVKGAATRAFSTHPNPNSKGTQKARGESKKLSVKMGKIPNKNPKGF